MDIGAFIRMLLALIATLGLLGLVAYAAKRFDIMSFFSGEQKQAPKTLTEFFLPKPGQIQKRLHIVEQRILDARTRLMVIRWDNDEHLILVGNGGDSLLASKAAPPAPPESAPARATISGGAA